MRCALIEDDLDDQEIFLLCLEKVRPDVDCVVLNNGVDALQKLRSEQDFVPEIIFLDVNMPKMNGLDCLKQLRAIPKLSNSCIYMYSTTSEDWVIQESKVLGADEYIVKPASSNKISEEIAKALKGCQRGGTENQSQ